MTTLTFKSARAAKMAMTKAEKEYVKIMNWDRGWALAELREKCASEEEFTARQAECKVVADAAWERAKAVWDAAQAQGFYVCSMVFKRSATRDLISMNMD